MNRAITKSYRHKLCKHGYAICPECIFITDAAKRMAATVNGIIAFSRWWDIRDKWMAFKLADGSTDNVLYDSRTDAIRCQLDERFCAYLCMHNLAFGLKELDAQIYLEFHRQAYDQNLRLHEPEAPQLIMPTDWYDRILKNVRKGPMRMDINY
jgi:hypothetical protein